MRCRDSQELWRDLSLKDAASSKEGITSSSVNYLYIYIKENICLKNHKSEYLCDLVVNEWNYISVDSFFFASTSLSHCSSLLSAFLYSKLVQNN